MTKEIIVERIIAALKWKKTPMVFSNDEIHGLANYLSVFISTGDEKRLGECASCGENHQDIKPRHWNRREEAPK